MAPTPATPVIVNVDGTADILVYEARTFRMIATIVGLADPTGYKVRFGLAAGYTGGADGAALLADADSENVPPDGTITLVPSAGDTIATVIIPKTLMVGLGKSGKYDMVVEEPDGSEFSRAVGKYYTFGAVTP
jgi:hypothetical protein